MNERTDLMRKISLLIATLLILGAAPTVRAESPAEARPADEASPQVLLDAVQANRKGMVEVNLQLTDDEATKFWPVYDRYQKEINAIGDRLLALIEEYTKSFSELSDDKSMKIVEDYLTIEADRVKVRRSYVDEFAKALPGRKVARFYQIENKIDAVVRYDLAATIPVIDDEEVAPAE
jgi:hypothetical protein